MDNFNLFERIWNNNKQLLAIGMKIALLTSSLAYIRWVRWQKFKHASKNERKINFS